MATSRAAGLGRKKPLLDIPIDRLELDPKNPRLPEDVQGGSQDDLAVHLFDHFDLDEIAESMAKNGYFDEEPIVAIPSTLPVRLRNFKFRNTPAGQREYNAFINGPGVRFVVAEGNRRLATAKLLHDEDLRKRLRRGKGWPRPSQEVLEDISVLPTIVYAERLEVLPYLGVRHITGNKKWDSYAKARYIDEMLKSGKTIEDIEQDVGDKGQAVRKNSIAYNLLRVAREDLGYDITRAKSDFSLLLLALGQKSIKRFLGWEKSVNDKVRSLPLSEIELSQPIEEDLLPNLKLLLEFLYGDGAKLHPAIKESRDITNYLAVVLGSKDATKYLTQTRNLVEAYELTDGEEVLTQKLIHQANVKLERALGIAHRHPTEDVIAEAQRCLQTARQLNKSLENGDV
ncbi:MAG: hypothetical protein NDI91_14425 [Sulfuritalea sp.]|nr:hypothetical protein [Sulfuritalea sp.]